MWDVIVLIPDHCLSIYFTDMYACAALKVLNTCTTIRQRFIKKTFQNFHANTFIRKPYKHERFVYI